MGATAHCLIDSAGIASAYTIQRPSNLCLINNRLGCRMLLTVHMTHQPRMAPQTAYAAQQYTAELLVRSSCSAFMKGSHDVGCTACTAGSCRCFAASLISQASSQRSEPLDASGLLYSRKHHTSATRCIADVQTVILQSCSQVMTVN